jgi:transcriptional regulator with XRE-family HTH domain
VYVIMDGEKVEAMRQERGLERGLSRQELAQEAGVATTTVARVEAGGAAVRLRTVRGLGRALGVDHKSLGRPARKA